MFPEVPCLLLKTNWYKPLVCKEDGILQTSFTVDNVVHNLLLSFDKERKGNRTGVFSFRCFNVSPEVQRLFEVKRWSVQKDHS